VEVQKRMFFVKTSKIQYVAFPRLVGMWEGEKAKTKGGPGTKQAIFYTFSNLYREVFV
jgi:hypothetical protein